VVAFWSLGVEEKFYMLAPLVIVPLLGMRHLRAALGVLVLFAAAPIVLRTIAYARAESWTYTEYFFAMRSPFHMCSDALWIGAACAFVFAGWERTGARPEGTAFRIAGAAAIGAALLVTPLLDDIGRFVATMLGTVLALGFGACLLGVLAKPGPVLRRMLGSWPLLVFSRLSYSLYLVHMVFLGSVYIALGSWLRWETWPAAARFLVYAPCLVLVSMAAAAILHYAVEKPFLTIKDRI
jgi:peptidoglycan/LPS O-acetylase OafA/YrhL